MRESAEHCFSSVGLRWSDHVRFDPRYLRPTEVDALIGDASKARELLGRAPEVMPDELARVMVDAEPADLGRTRDPAVARRPNAVSRHRADTEPTPSQR